LKKIRGTTFASSIQFTDSRDIHGCHIVNISVHVCRINIKHYYWLQISFQIWPFCYYHLEIAEDVRRKTNQCVQL